MENSKPDPVTGKSQKYELVNSNATSVKRYQKTRVNKDIWGNNVFHYVWDVDEGALRDKMLLLLMAE